MQLIKIMKMLGEIYYKNHIEYHCLQPSECFWDRGQSRVNTYIGKLT